MCGIAGFIDFGLSQTQAILASMISKLRHRGPDGTDCKIFHTDSAVVGLAHARLAIIDLSNHANQPMSHGQLTIVFNGEIYNFQEVKAELISLGHSFCTNSDTEVILHAFAEWKTESISKLIGMFSFVIFDAKEGKCFLVRDRVGVKPLYVYKGNNIWLFASELRAFRESPRFSKRLNPNAVYSFFQNGFTSDGDSIFQNCLQVGPGEIWELDCATRNLTTHKYWDPVQFAHLEKAKISFEEATDKLHDLLVSACNYRMISDVPVGLFLSGGYDSATTAAILQQSRTEKIKTFTIGFRQGNNEAPQARRIAEFLETDHHEFICDDEEARKILPEIASIFDEPFADSSAIPTALVSRHANRLVKVALSADGGDELFAGYSSYQRISKLLAKHSKIPEFSHGLLRLLLKSASNIPGNRFRRIAHNANLIGTSLDTNPSLFASRINSQERQLPSYFLDRMFSGEFLAKVDRKAVLLEEYSDLDPIEAALLIDYRGYLRNDILVKVDRCTMNTSLEGREPLLDHRLFEFAAQLPTQYKFGKGNSKRVLKAVAHRMLPKELLDRPKSGFSAPINQWMRGPLFDFVNDHVNQRLLNSTGIFNADFLIQQFEFFKRNRLHYSNLIFRVLIFNSWASNWLD